MPLLTPSELNSLEMMLRDKLGSGAGTSALLKVLNYVSDHAGPSTAPDPIVLPELVEEPATVEVTESSP